MDGCLFCQILDGSIPSAEVATSERTYAFRDISPVAPTHVLVIPRAHIANAADLGPGDGDLLAEMVATAQGVAASEGIADSGYRLLFNVGDDAGNLVPHLHLHVVGGRQLGWPPG
jgi:histidine triad (HIT) family protein